MELFIREKEVINFDKDFSKFGSAFEINKLIIDDNLYLKFHKTFNYILDSEYLNKTIIIRVVFSSISSSFSSIVVRDENNTLLTTTLPSINNIYEFKIKPTENKIIFDVYLNDYTQDIVLSKFEILELDFKHINIDSDINIVYNYYDDIDTLFEVFTKSFNIYKNELFGYDINKLYDAYIIHNSIILLSGELSINKYVDDEHYEVTIENSVNGGLNNIKDLKLCDYSFPDVVSYTHSDYIDVIENGVNNGVYSYYISRENQVQDAFIGTSYKEDFTTINCEWQNNITKKFHFNTYIRPAISYRYLFDLAHKISNYSYEIDNSIFDDLYLTTNFYKNYNWEFNEKTFKPIDINIIESELPKTYIDDELLNFTDNTNKIITYNFIVDLETTEFTIDLTYDDGTGGGAEVVLDIEFWTLDELGNKKIKIREINYPNTIIPSPTLAVPFTVYANLAKYLYSDYSIGVFITLRVEDVTGGDGLLHINFTGDLNANVTNTYKIQQVNTDIKISDLFYNTDLTFLNIIKTITQLYNLTPIIKNNKIYYSKNEEILTLDKFYLDKFSNKKYTKEFNGINKIKYSYNDSELNELLDYNYLEIISNKTGDIVEKEINTNIVFENQMTLYSNDFFYADWSYFLDKYVKQTDNDTINYRFDVLKDELDYILPSLCFIKTEEVLANYGIFDWYGNVVTESKFLPIITSFNKDKEYGLWFNKNDDVELYRYNMYSDIDKIITIKEYTYVKFNNSVYKNYEMITIDVYLNELDIIKIKDYNLIILENYIYFVKQLTISNNGKSQLIAIKIT